MDISIEKTGIIDAVWPCMWIGGCCPSGAVGSLSGRLARQVDNLKSVSVGSLWYAFFYKVLCFDIIFPGVLGIPIEMIVISDCMIGSRSKLPDARLQEVHRAYSRKYERTG